MNTSLKNRLTAGPRWTAALLFLAFGIMAACSLPACRTTEGLGRDVEHLGDNVADSAEKHTPD